MSRFPFHFDTGRWRLRADAAWLVLVIGVVVPALSYLLPGNVQLHFLLFFSGAGLAALFFRSGNLTEWIGLSIAGSIVLWSAWTGVLWYARLSAPLALRTAILGTNVLLVLVLRSRPKRVTFRVGRFDILALALWALIRALQVAVFTRNGFMAGPAGEETFVARGWFAKDTMYFYALVEQAAEGRSWPVWNPFFGGVEIAYPRLIHVGLAGLLTQSGERIGSAASGLMGLGLIPIVTLGLGLVKSAARRARRAVSWPIASALLFYAIALRLDLVVYPQTQFFVIGAFLLLARSMMVPGLSHRDGEGRWIAAGWVLTAFLVFAHQVSGTAAFFSWVLFTGVMGRRRRWSVWGWGAWAASAAALLLILVLPGRDPHLRPPGGKVNWEVVGVWLGNLRGWLPAVMFTAWAGGLLRRLRPQLGPAAGLLAITVCVVFWGGMQDYVHSRIILVFNAERYLYHGFLLAFPAAALLFSHLWWQCKRRPGLRFLLVLLLVVPFLQLPALAYRSRELVTGEPVVVSSAQLQAYRWIRDQTPIDTVFLRERVRVAPDVLRIDRTLPALTGRCLYVADKYNIWGYTHVPAYEHSDRLRFFNGVHSGRLGPDALAQDCRARGIDYVFLSESDESSPADAAFRSPWFETVHRIGGVSIVRPAGEGQPRRTSGPR